MPSKPVNKEAPLNLMLEDDTISLDEEDFHHRSAILDALDQMDVDEDPDADETNNDVNEIDVMSDSLPKMPSPPLTVVKKRKRGPTDDLKRPASVTKDISYMMLVFSAAEMRKAKSKRVATAASVDLSSDEPWDNLKAQVLVEISKTIKPPILNYDDYTVTYQISRVLPKPGLSLATQADFDGMRERVNAMHGSKSPLVNIVVQEHAAANKNGNDDDEDLENNAKAKNKKRKESAAILPGNERRLKNIQLLRDLWTCKRTDSACPFTHCYIIPGTEEHLPLGHKQFDCWASAMCKNTGDVTLDKPPNHRLFDTKGTALSPVLQHRLNLAASTSASLAPVINVTFVNEFANPFMTIQAPQIASASASLAPVINITFGNEFANPFKPIQAPQIAPTADVATLPGSSRSLIPFSRKPGNDMSISAFCTYYNLDDSIAMKFNSHSFKKARLLRYVTFTDLKDMEFKFGEIAALRDAVEKWSIPY